MACSILLARSENWKQRHRQHDAGEFLQHLSLHIPILEPAISRSRILAGEEILDEEAQLALHLHSDLMSISACVRAWAWEQGAIHALMSAPPVLVIPVIRFTYDDRLPRRATERLRLESHLDIPVYIRADSIETEMIAYRLVACILHTGPTPQSGHYRALVCTDGGYVISDDDRYGDYHAHPPPEELKNITSLYLLRVSYLEDT